jgi:hypothetical protein
MGLASSRASHTTACFRSLQAARHCGGAAASSEPHMCAQLQLVARRAGPAGRRSADPHLPLPAHSQGPTSQGVAQRVSWAAAAGSSTTVALWWRCR